MGKIEVINHPLIQHKLSILRRTDTSTKAFRELVDEIAMLMGYEVLRDLPLEDVEIETPITKTVQKQLAGKKLAIVPILRAGIGMVDGLLSLVPAAKVGHIGMYRDEETLQPVEYLVKLPEDIDQRQIFVVDPMLATGGSAILAVDSLKKRGASNIKFSIKNHFFQLEGEKPTYLVPLYSKCSNFPITSCSFLVTVHRKRISLPLNKSFISCSENS